MAAQDRVTGQLQHADAAQAVAQPFGDLAPPRIDQRHPLATRRRLIDRLTQRAGDGRFAMAQLSCDLPQTLAALAQQVDDTAFHAS